MEAVILIGIQASGKSTFYARRLADTHAHISRDLLGTRAREQQVLRSILAARQAFAVDNTNVLAEERARFILPARAAGYRVLGYFFPTPTRAAIARNRLREGTAVIPLPAILATHKKLQPPRMDEGFDALYAVTLTPCGDFDVEPLAAEPSTG